MNTITYYCNTPALQQLSSIYGPRWEGMDLVDRTDIMVTLSIAANYLSVNERTDNLLTIARSFDIEFTDHDIPPLLAQLDAELSSLQDLLYLIAGIAQTTPLRQLERAA